MWLADFFLGFFLCGNRIGFYLRFCLTCLLAGQVALTTAQVVLMWVSFFIAFSR